MGLLIGLDVGTTSTIGVLATPDGRIVAERHRAVRLFSEHAGWAEEDAAEWWANACAILRELAECHRQAGERFVVGAGCEVPRDTPHANLHALTRYAHEHGQ